MGGQTTPPLEAGKLSLTMFAFFAGFQKKGISTWSNHFACKFYFLPRAFIFENNEFRTNKNFTKLRMRLLLVEDDISRKFSSELDVGTVNKLSFGFFWRVFGNLFLQFALIFGKCISSIFDWRLSVALEIYFPFSHV
ncbi:hypothetical protein K501DRAFT_273628 [Backusella circina FSU 941]|nr:hypothetical protein K501DRAFT_280740 [Backusella circina FSU 941]KAI8882444.1 hypothetical protein K501DRAFT_273628 [Backusella circina FSU 941]